MLRKEAIERMDDNTKNVIFGYIHSLEKKYKEIIVPQLIIYICAAFYYIMDEFDDKLVAKDVVFTDDNACIHSEGVLGGGWRTVYGKCICKDNEIYNWKIKFVDVDLSKTNNTWKTIFGIIKNDDELMKSKLQTFFIGDKDSYGFVGSQGMKTQTPYTSEGIKYGEILQNAGDIIEIVLDLNNYTLSYIMNGTDYGVAYEVESNVEYRLAVGIVSGVTLKLV